MTEDFLAVVEAKRFLGREFLTWLVHTVEEGGGRIDVEGGVIEITLGDRIVLEGGGIDRPRLTVVGQGDLGPELGAGLRRGKVVDRAHLVLTRGDRRWELTLDGGMLTYDSLRCPELGEGDHAADDPRVQFENGLYLRLADVDEAIGVLDRLFADFCKLRGASAWSERTLPTLRRWIETLG